MDSISAARAPGFEKLIVLVNKRIAINGSEVPIGDGKMTRARGLGGPKVENIEGMGENHEKIREIGKGFEIYDSSGRPVKRETYSSRYPVDEIAGLEKPDRQPEEGSDPARVNDYINDNGLIDVVA